MKYYIHVTINLAFLTFILHGFISIGLEWSEKGFGPEGDWKDTLSQKLSWEDEIR